jgi:hypothetical protein
LAPEICATLAEYDTIITSSHSTLRRALRYNLSERYVKLLKHRYSFKTTATIGCGGPAPRFGHLTRGEKLKYAYWLQENITSHLNEPSRHFERQEIKNMQSTFNSALSNAVSLSL